MAGCRGGYGVGENVQRTAAELSAGGVPEEAVVASGGGGEEGPVAVAHAKRFCPDAALRAAIACSEALGAYGWLDDTPLPRFISLAKMLQVVDGTAEIQRVVIGRELDRMARSGS